MAAGAAGALVLVAIAAAGLVYVRRGPGAAPASAPPIAGTTTIGDEQVILASFADARRGSVTILTHPHGFDGAQVSYLTSDGGLTWSRGDRVRFLAGGTAIQWSSGSASARVSTDGGRTWRRLDVPELEADGTAPVFLDSRHGWWAVGLSGPNPGLARIWRSNDGGSTWRQLATAGLPASMWPEELSWLDSRRGTLSMSGATGPSLFLTEDGGGTWRATLTPAYPLAGAHPLLLYMMKRSGNHLLEYLAAIRPRPATAASESPDDFDTYLFSSDDGGRTWGPPIAGPHFRSTAIDGPVVDAGGRLLLLDGPRLWVSEDSGATWAPEAFNAPTGWMPTALLHDADRTLFAIATSASATVPDGLLRSTDGGAHWEQVPLPG